MDFRTLIKPSDNTKTKASVINFGFGKQQKKMNYETDKYFANRYAPVERNYITKVDSESSVRQKHDTSYPENGLKLKFNNVENIPLTARIPNKQIDDNGQKTSYIGHKTSVHVVNNNLSKSKK
jgi:hypothetical protein